MSSESLATEISALPRTRRIVTGNDANAKSKVLYDDTESGVQIMPGGTARLQDLWLTDSVPADCSSATDGDPTKKEFSLVNDGSSCRIACMSPGSSSPMHNTPTIDYGIVLEGEVELELEDGERKVMKPGDVVVQRGTMHAWHNRHATQWSKIFFVLIRAKDA